MRDENPNTPNLALSSLSFSSFCFGNLDLTSAFEAFERMFVVLRAGAVVAGLSFFTELSCPYGWFGNQVSAMFRTTGGYSNEPERIH